jgi:nucleoside-diphosphate-sugar epimerase
LKNLFKKENATFYYLERDDVDFLEKEKLYYFFDLYKPDIVIHCGGIVGSSQLNSYMDQLDIFNKNVLLNGNVLECCNAFHVKKLLLFSTYRIFDENIKSNYCEDDVTKHFDFELINGNNGYLLSKYVMDYQVKLLNKVPHGSLHAVESHHVVKIVCLILPNIFGSYDHFCIGGRIVPCLITRIHGEEQVIIDSFPQKTFCLIDVQDIIRIIDKCTEENDIEGNILILNKEAILTLEELSQTIKKIMKSATDIQFTKFQREYTEKNIMFPNLTKFETLFPDFEFTPLGKSLQNTVDYFYSIQQYPSYTFSSGTS